MKRGSEKPFGGQPSRTEGYQARCAKGREWAAAHAGEWFPFSFKRGAGEGQEKELRQVRVVGLHTNFALLEVRATGCGTWRETVGYDALAHAGQRRSAGPAPVKTLPCGCLVGPATVTLCALGRALWDRAAGRAPNGQAWLELDVHLQRVPRCKAG